MAAILKHLRDSGDARLSEVEKIFATVGTRGDRDSLYDRRNQAIHSIFARSTRDGGEIFRRIGHDDYRVPSPVNADFLTKLVADIGLTIDSLNSLVPA
jgi:hypothetical protein